MTVVILTHSTGYPLPPMAAGVAYVRGVTNARRTGGTALAHESNLRRADHQPPIVPISLVAVLPLPMATAWVPVPTALMLSLPLWVAPPFTMPMEFLT